MTDEETIIKLCEIYEHWRKYHCESDDTVYLNQSVSKDKFAWVHTASIFVNNILIFREEARTSLLDYPFIDFQKMKEDAMFRLATNITTLGMHTAYEQIRNYAAKATATR